MGTALAVVASLHISPPVVVVEHQMLPFVPDDVRYPLKIAGVLGNDERGRRISYHHSRGEYIPALVINGAGVLGGADRNVRRILSLAVLRAVCPSDKDGVIRIVQQPGIAITACHG